MSAIFSLGRPAEPLPVEEKKIGQKVADAAAEPIKGLKESFRFWHSVGNMFVCLARPKRAISQFFASCLRSGWEKAGVDSAVQSAVAKSCNAAQWLSGKDVNWMTAKDIADWQVPAPTPAMLRNMKRAAEQCGVPSMIGTVGKTTLKLTNGAYHKLYGEALVELPDISPEMINLLFGTQSKLPFSERVDAYFLESLNRNPIIEESQRKWVESFPVVGVIGDDIAHIQNELKKALRESILQTLDDTSLERRALVEALEGVALSFLYNKIAAYVPKKEFFIREIVLSAIQNYFNPLSVIHHFFPEHLQKAIDAIPDEHLKLAKTVASLDFIESAASVVEAGAPIGAALTAVGAVMAGRPREGILAGAVLSVAGGKIANVAFTIGATKGLEYGPATAVVLYKIIYQELEKLAGNGNQRVKDFSFLNLVWGISSEPREVAPVDPNADYLTPIASEFVLGTLNRLCENNGLLAILYEAFGEMRKERAPSAPSQPLPGVAELKTALGNFVATLQSKLMENLRERTRIVFLEECKRQSDDVAKVSQTILENRESIQRSHAAFIAGVLGSSVSEESVYNVLNAPATIFNYFTQNKGSQ